MADAPEDEHEWKPSPEARHLFKMLGRFTQNQEELLYIADYIIEKKSDMDDQKEQTRIYASRLFPNVQPDLFDDTWDVLASMRQEALGETWEDEGPAPEDPPSEIELREAERPASSDARDISTDSLEGAIPDSANRSDDPDAFNSDPGGTTSDSTGTDGEKDDAFDSVLSRLPDNCRFEYVTAVSKRINQERRHSPRVLSSLLTSVVADFEVMVGGLLRHAISHAPRLIESSERTYTWADIAIYSDLDEFKSAQIDNMVDNILYGNFQSWLEFLSKRFGISAAALATADETIEIFQRRNLVVHTGGQVSQQYLDNVDKAFHVKLGTSLTVDVEYLQRASDTMLVMGVSLVYSVAAKMVKDEASLRWLEEDIAGGLVYNLLQAQRFWAVSGIIESLDLDSFSSKGAALRGQVNGWLALKRQGRFDVCRKKVENWDTSVLEPIFKLARAALLDDFEYAEVLASDLRGTPDLPILHYLTWPLLDELREYERANMRRARRLEAETAP
ncbi:hypothetical protein ACFVRV_14200 [Arthrobacter koreensis]|uniref:hypothetical protein n=1 Tax=Arthrobacter koreensis TaxID=199136 RepID=UPI0036DF6173